MNAVLGSVLLIVIISIAINLLSDLPIGSSTRVPGDIMAVRQQVLRILHDLITERNIGLVFISHDLNLVKSVCDRVIIMYAGRTVETIEAPGSTKQPIPIHAPCLRRCQVLTIPWIGWKC